MSSEGCRTDSDCCYQDDSGAEELRNLCVGLGVALFLCLTVMSWVIVTWKCPRALKLPKNIPVPSANPPEPNSGGGQDAAASDDKHEGTGSTASTPQNYNIHTSDVERSRAMDEERDRGSDISGEFEGEGMPEPPILRSCSSQLSLRSFRSLRSSTSLDNLELQPQMSCPAPPSPASTVAQEDINRLRFLLDSERSRRMAAESYLGRRTNTPSSLGTPSTRMSFRKFPSPRSIEGHALEVTENASRWVRSTFIRKGSMEPELPFLVTRVLAHAFGTCRGEARKRLNARVGGFRVFIGGGEEIQLGRKGDGMAPETRELLYSELQRRYRTIAAVGRQDLVSIAARVLSRALKTEKLREFGRMVVHKTWPSFEPLLRSYLALFVECQLQQPEVTFEDLFVGREEAFDPHRHRELARFMDTEDADTGLNRNGTCCVVFPAIVAAKARIQPSEAARGGVIMWSEDYVKF